MPWMPEVFTAPIAEAIRHREVENANDAVAYYEGIMANQAEALVRSFAGKPVLDDPRVGYVEGRRKLRAFVNGTADWLRERDAVVENVALTRTTTLHCRRGRAAPARGRRRAGGAAGGHRGRPQPGPDAQGHPRLPQHVASHGRTPRALERGSGLSREEAVETMLEAVRSSVSRHGTL